MAHASAHEAGGGWRGDIWPIGPVHRSSRGSRLTATLLNHMYRPARKVPQNAHNDFPWEHPDRSKSGLATGRRRPLPGFEGRQPQRRGPVSAAKRRELKAILAGRWPDEEHILDFDEWDSLLGEDEGGTWERDSEDDDGW